MSDGSNQEVNKGTGKVNWDHSSHKEFYDYYAKAGQSKETLDRFGSLRDIILRIMALNSSLNPSLDVADVGCGSGTQSMMWAEIGHHVHGLDVNEPLLDLARQRAADANLLIEYQVGSAVKLPWMNSSMDVCLVPELLEHVLDWEICLDEFTRILRPGGVLLLTTTNKLCPKQQEFNLPLYSWYPQGAKRYFEKLAVTSRPNLANFAKYPAVNWFTFYGLRSTLATRGFWSMDRFDLIDLPSEKYLLKWILGVLRRVPLLRFLGHVVTPYTIVVAVKNDETSVL